MEIVIKPNIVAFAMNSGKLMSSTQKYYGTLERMSKLESIPVQTINLFDNGFNALFEDGIVHVFEEDVLRVIGDERDDYRKCMNCGKLVGKTQKTCGCNNPLLYQLESMETKKNRMETEYLNRGYNWRGENFAKPPEDVVMQGISKGQLIMVFAKAGEIARELSTETVRRIALPGGMASNFRVYKARNGKSYIIGDEESDIPGAETFLKVKEEKFPAVELII